MLFDISIAVSELKLKSRTVSAVLFDTSIVANKLPDRLRFVRFVNSLMPVASVIP